ncbi:MULTISPECIES: zinc-dependent alcohol dehydrogenase family protein [Sphingobium]|uniref:zinc-dependent alcohol dehydrogenase family protein n=1 Tax=Sphingobium TaxID=165695 RepID=UPI0015EC9CF8|nr:MULTISPECIES: zinc-dependent alcohol dehydrogenase family protein [Sphingobium]MCW2363301.1 NADPH:quinone reductase-like Zn-dependent oxidoreductase [Sphingobium sp. B10D3B]MCW2403300.1 NADPH:quinone reductase-like Zn-dependent oxidoreductase [Sphingobium sp. B10D7B]MCW2406997.1 NADPH:quinone reductase-like Zn-dependent oxidoreductase [Sphingobium xanthum]
MAKVVRVHELGPPDVLRFDEIAVGAPGPGEVRIRVEAIGLNRSEAMFRAGRYPTKPTLPTLIGYEACGIIEALGDGVSGFAVGDRVCALPMYPLGQYGVWAEQAIVPARCLLHAPPGLSAAQAAAVWMQYMTAYAIIEVGKAGIGDYVIIPAASSSVGLAAIQLANWAGAISIAATRTSDKAETLKAHGAAHVIATGETDLVEAVMQITDGKGARLVFDPVQGPYVQTLTSAMAERGILFIYGGLSEQPTPYPHWNMAFKGLSMRGWVASEIWNHPERYKRAQEHILLGLKLGKLKPVIARTFPFSEIVEANRYLESNQQIGKIVVTV